MTSGPRGHSRIAILLALIIINIWVSIAAAADRAETEETARLLANLLRAGRLVIDDNQKLIDDPHRGDKQFTPAVFEQAVMKRFRDITGIDLSGLDKLPTTTMLPPLAKRLLPDLLEAEKEVVNDAQIVINQKGVGFKNFIPATFGSQAASRFSKRSQVRLKQTTVNPRNPKNEPDDYEASVLKWLSGRPRAEAYVSELTDEGRTLRVVMPIYYQKECLTCHGEPKGDLDISGYPKEGHKEGDLAGAITVTAPITMK
jgi:general secretion pathway protein A